SSQRQPAQQDSLEGQQRWQPTKCSDHLLKAFVRLIPKISNNNLHCPMYLFLTNSSIFDILLASTIVPNMLCIVINNGSYISFTGCVIQFCIFGSSESSESFILCVMSYDRYVAIFYSLKYNTTMNPTLCLKLAIVSWLLSFAIITSNAATICSLQFCGPLVVDHFFCDLAPLLELSCSDTTMIQMITSILSNKLHVGLVMERHNVMRLQSPMYLFLAQLSVSDIFLITNIVPSTLHIVLGDGGTMSFAGCLVQFYVFSVSETFECLLLTLMAYDRYLAICNPLHYSSLMKHAICIKLIIMSWLLSFSIILIDTISISRLHFCGPNIIDHFFCDLSPLLSLSCSDTSIIMLEVSIMSIPVVIFPLIIIIISYAYIVLTILEISSSKGRWKTFVTCSSHLTVVSIYYGTLSSISHLTVVSIFYGTLNASYMIPANGDSLNVNKLVSLLYTVVTPMINPIIYSLRNNDIKEAIKILKACGQKGVRAPIDQAKQWADIAGQSTRRRHSQPINGAPTQLVNQWAQT
ncbi:olfactory receptor 11L1-like, partial [Pelobates cultripes]